MSKNDDDRPATGAEDATVVVTEPESGATELGGTEEADGIETVASSSADEQPTVVASSTTDAPWRRWIVPIVLTVLLLAAAGTTAWLYFFQYRPDQKLGESSQNAALSAAADGVVAVLSYSPDSLDADFANAKSHLTGEFLDYYTDYTERVVTPAAKEKSVKTAAAVIRKALIDIEPDSARVLIFLNQTTTSKSMPDGSYSTSAVRVGLERHGDRWLISAFEPV